MGSITKERGRGELRSRSQRSERYFSDQMG